MSQEAREKLVDKFHTCSCEFVEFKEPTESKGASIVIDFTVADGPNTGTSIRGYFSLKGGAKQYTERDLMTMGWTGKRIKECPGVGRNKVRILVKREVWQGKESIKVKGVWPVKTKEEPANDASDDNNLPF